MFKFGILLQHYGGMRPLNFIDMDINGVTMSPFELYNLLVYLNRLIMNYGDEDYLFYEIPAIHEFESNSFIS